jgi:hypothetical protein
MILKRASAIRPSRECSEDDFDVLADGVVVGRIMKAEAVPLAQMWTLAVGITRIVRRRTATKRRARPRWRQTAQHLR